MSSSGIKILSRFQRRWQLLQIGEIVMYGLGAAVMVYALSLQVLLAIGAGVMVSVLFMVIKKPWRLTLEQISNYVDKQSDGMQHSTGLLLLPDDELTPLASLQQYEVSRTISQNISNVRPQVSIRNALVIFVLMVFLAFLGYKLRWAQTYQNGGEYPDSKNVVFQVLDSSRVSKVPPKVSSQKLTIRPPSYTKLGAVNQSEMQVRALKGSRVFWNIEFDAPVDSVLWKSSENTIAMKKTQKGYGYSTVLNTSDFYNFRFTDIAGASYQSELYALEVFEDEPPAIEIQNLKQFVSFTSEEEKIVNINARFSDDYGLNDAYIIATVSSGEGESVKFREERMVFDNVLVKGSKSQDLNQQINLDQLKMEPGDELYFYLAATDTKSPQPNTSRSETYFAVIEDTLSKDFEVESTMGADLMPAYFRSQRQLIIDTEKLIADRSGMPKKAFKNTSNSLGADQKSLRLKYGQFMGDEEDSSIRGGTVHIEDPIENDDPTAAYTHNHDSETEGAVEHEVAQGHEEHESALENYVHNHDDPEESTLFSQSLKSKLRLAMQHMWDAELQLRLYMPKKSLPFQYKALKLIQDIKNSARVYVHRIGFDAPPIKEENRLIGDIETVKLVQKNENLARSPVLPAIRKTIERLEMFVQEDKTLTMADRNTFESAGIELATLAVAEPGKYLETLQELRWLTDTTENISLNSSTWDKKQLKKLSDGLLKAIPPPTPTAEGQQSLASQVNRLFLQELNVND